MNLQLVVCFYLLFCIKWHLFCFLILFIFLLICLDLWQVHIVQRGAVRPLIEMLQSPDVQLREMSAFALGRLAQVPFSFSLYLLVLLFTLVFTCNI